MYVERPLPLRTVQTRKQARDAGTSKKKREDNDILVSDDIIVFDTSVFKKDDM